MTTSIEAFFLDASAARTGQRFCLFHPATGGVARGALVYLHPFAEEMNKVRRMAALQSRAFAERGFAVLQIDLFGCGDSSGEFGDANWDDWVDDATLAIHWIRARVAAPLWLWGVRGGALLACEAASRIEAPCDFLLWQPSVSGKSLLQQFLRLRTAAALGESQAKGATEGLRAELAAGNPVEIAGYELSPGLAGPLHAAVLKPPPRPTRSIWLETTTREEPSSSPVVLEAAGRWRAAGHEVEAAAVRGPLFWQSSEIEVAPSLLEATLSAMSATAANLA